MINIFIILSILGLGYAGPISTQLTIPQCEGVNVLYKYKLPLPANVHGRCGMKKKIGTFSESSHLAMVNSDLKGIFSGIFFDEDPNVLKKILVLCIQNRFVGDLNATTFKNFQELKELYLISGEMRHIDEGAFDDVRNLEILDLTGNKLKIIDKKFLNSLKKLKQLILNDNQLEELTVDQIPELPELEEIQAKNNKFSHVNVEELKTKCPKLTRVLV